MSSRVVRRREHHERARGQPDCPDRPADQGAPTSAPECVEPAPFVAVEWHGRHHRGPNLKSP
ncbi:MAG TPA: hypothetical protein VH108_09075 [Gaiellaceae bacterium]|nr:hypothetical protein [Gaiellaceae bacterium]